METCKVVDSERFREYKRHYQKRPPNLKNKKFDDELQKLGSDDGLVEFCFYKMDNIEAGSPPVNRDEPDGINKYVWVIMDDTIPLVLEHGEAGRKLTRGSVSHTNLTGGTEAYCGGEMWFSEDGNTLWLSGGSSRYQARNENELEMIESWFGDCNYKVLNFGWDDEIPGPARIYRKKSG